MLQLNMNTITQMHEFQHKIFVCKIQRLQTISRVCETLKSSSLKINQEFLLIMFTITIKQGICSFSMMFYKSYNDFITLKKIFNLPFI